MTSCTKPASSRSTRGSPRSVTGSRGPQTRAFFLEYDRAEELAALSPAVQAEVVAAFDAALAHLPDSAFTWNARLVAAMAVEPRRG